MTLPIHEKAASGVLSNALVGDVSGARDSNRSGGRSGRKMPTLFSCVKCGELPHVKEVLTGASYPYDVRKEVRCQCGVAAMYFEPHEEIRAYGRWNKKQRLGVGGEKTPRLEADSSPTEPSSGTGSAEPVSTGEGARAPSLFPAAHGSANCKRRVRNEAEREAGAEPG